MSISPLGGPTVTTNLNTLDQLQAQGQTPVFASETDKTAYLEAVAQAKEDAKSGVANPTLQFPAPTNAAALGLTVDNLNTAISNVPFSLDDLMATLHQLASELKKAAREARAADQQSQIGAIKAQAEDMRQSANFALAAGVVQGATQIAGGLVSGIGAIKSTTTSLGEVQDFSTSTGKLDTLKQALFYADDNKNLGAPEQVVTRGRSDAVTSRADAASGSGRAAPTAKYSAAQMETARQNAANVSARWQALSQVTQGIGGVGSAVLEYQSKGKDAQQKDDEALATKIGYQAQSWDDMVKSMQDMMADVRGKLSDMIQAQNQVATKIWS